MLILAFSLYDGMSRNIEESDSWLTTLDLGSSWIWNLSPAVM